MAVSGYYALPPRYTAPMSQLRKSSSVVSNLSMKKFNDSKSVAQTAAAIS
jgi:hypothetical protein